MWRNRIRQHAPAEVQRRVQQAFDQASILAFPSQLVCADGHQQLYRLAFELARAAVSSRTTNLR